jgi:hypothetical protein
MMSFCGRYASSGGRRFDLTSVIEEPGLRQMYGSFIVDVQPLQGGDSGDDETEADADIDTDTSGDSKASAVAKEEGSDLSVSRSSHDLRIRRKEK